MRLLKTFQRGFRVLLLFVGITTVFSLPALVRCAGSVDPEDSTMVSMVDNGE
jgi:hypothetical protein